MMRTPFRTIFAFVFVAAPGCSSDVTTPLAVNAAAGSPGSAAGTGVSARAGAFAPIANAGSVAPSQPVGATTAGVGAAVAGSGGAGTTAGSMSLGLPSAGVGGAAGASAGAGKGGAGAPAPSGLPDITFSYDVHVPTGAELLMCKYVALPTDRGTIAVSSSESHYTPGSHHMEAFRTDLTAIPANQADVWDCKAGMWFTHDRGVYYEAQQPDSHRELPPGVAHEFKPGEIVLLQSHYVNTTSADLEAHVAFTLHTLDMKDVKFEAGSILFSNARFSLAPHSKSRVTMTCPLSQDIHPAELWSHMHKQGTAFLATSSDKTAAALLGDSLYHEADWNEPHPRMYDPATTLHSGTTITFSCDFDNDTDRTITYGDSALTNEMCIFHGMYWPRMPAGDEGCYQGMASQMPL
jgi:hypothetical protein